ncbi:hypothetical protein, variant [Puccinia striiformis f. sp. tritici PST-78]|uniref:Large ribosomal subunit protein mL46 N-terminal domain-containing protein n=1 Tax=Puccinia striiformis f. sp. tritici PST-78 TaxID=1165861 RepID=A0A0L0VET4_9BASI|nr:hypothetical protein PSTG_08843 [Puccinia striiformis f. sp. tritici PST-78]KNE97822.1 hypothetical protein, variant [Puccinia striiformis f. sp. tritici PST-78]
MMRNKLNQVLAENLLLSTTRSNLASKSTASHTIARAISTESQAEPSPSTSTFPPPPAELLPVRPSTSKHRRPTTNPNASLVAAALLSRSPLLLRPLNEFEKSYYQYQRELTLALSKRVNPAFFFRTGSHAAKAFELASQSNLATLLPEPPADQQDSNQTLKSFSINHLEREPHRSLYLFIKYKHKSEWQLPTSKILPTDNLIQASLRAVHSKLGPNMDIWSVGKVPATVYKPTPSSGSKIFEKVWIMPQRILRGKPDLSFIKPSSSKVQQQQLDQGLETEPQIEDFAWFTSDEIADKVDPLLREALEPVLRS